ncbi:MAG: flagellar filament capping protein FliD [Burkholderiales bacterium]|nr:flagellar filament capping protein FliD [Burkholderiales bacterium]
MATTSVGGAIDVRSIVSQLMAVERQPLQAMQKSASGIQTKLSAFGTLQGKLSSFQDAARELFNLDTWRPAQASTSDETAAKATAALGAIPGSYELTVTQLAQRQTLAGPVLASSTTVVGGGTLRIQLGTYDSGTNSFTVNPDKAEVPITIAAGATMADIRDAINGASAGVSASIVNDGTGSRLVVRGLETGAKNSIRMLTTDSDGTNTNASGLSSLAFDPTAVTGSGKNLTQTQAAQDAAASVSGIAVTSATNQVEGVIENVTLDLRKAGTGAINVNVATDNARMRQSVDKFVNAWNDLNRSLNDQTRFDPNTKSAGTLQGNNSVIGLQRQLRATMQSVMSGTGLTRVSEAGLEVQRDGSLTVNSSKMSALLATPDKLKALFGNSSDTDASAIGIGRRFDTLLTGMLGDSGTVTSATTALKSRQTSIQQQQTRLEQRMTQIEARLMSQYTTLDKTMSSMNTTAAALAAKFG